VPIKIKKQNLAIPNKDSANMCSGCLGHCCKLHVDLTIYDILRISELEKKEFDSFVQLYEADETDAFGIKSMGKLVKFSLAKKADGFCAFFDSKSGLYCTIENSKPGICLMYPMSIKEGTIVLRDDAVCPDENKKKADFSKMNHQVLEDYDWEWKKYYEYVVEWNSFAKGDENPNDFIRYAIEQVKHEMTPIGRFYRKIKKLFRSTG
jgi:Fe-S-cluster containining protein